MTETSIKRSTRYCSLDFWRGVACLMIVVFHASLYFMADAENQGGVAQNVGRLLWLTVYGVPVFFVISGYCITAACESMRDRARPAGEYFYRRVRRIFPPYWITLLLTLGLVTLLSACGYGWLVHDDAHAAIPTPGSLSALKWTTNVTLTETMRYSIQGSQGDFFAGFFLIPAWSLCYEEQFYIVCGLALFLTPKWFFKSLLGVTIAVAGLFVAMFFVDIPVRGFFFDGRWLNFAAGILVYYRVNHKRGSEGRWCDALLIVATIGLFVLSIKTRMQTQLIAELRIGFAFAVLISLIHRWDAAIASSKLLRPITWCGVMCYSLYLVHWPIGKAISHLLFANGVRGVMGTLLVTIPVCMIVSLAAAWVFHVLVERRFLNAPMSASQKAPSTPTAAGDDPIKPALVAP